MPKFINADDEKLFFVQTPNRRITLNQLTRTDKMSNQKNFGT